MIVPRRCSVVSLRKRFSFSGIQFTIQFPMRFSTRFSIPFLIQFNFGYNSVLKIIWKLKRFSKTTDPLKRVKFVFVQVGRKYTGCMSRKKTLSLKRLVALEYHEHLIGRCDYWMRFFGTAESTKSMTVRRVAVVYRNLIVSAFLMRLHLEDFEHLLENL